MGTIVTTPTSCREIIDRAGGDPSLADYNSVTQTLTAPDVSDADLATAQAAIAGRTARATTTDKRAKAAVKAAEALQRQNDAVLAADATYQAELTAIAAAVTLADLDAV
jgi:uncharacterized protein (UPF0261 family)